MVRGVFGVGFEVIDCLEAQPFGFAVREIRSDPGADIRFVQEVHEALEIFLLGHGLFLLGSEFGFFLVDEAPPASPVEIHMAAIMGAVLKAAEFAGEFSELFPAFFGVFDFVQLRGVLRQLSDGDVHEVVARERAGGVAIDSIGAFDHPTGLVDGFLVADPIGIAAFAPVREVFFVDRLGIEKVAEDAFDFGEAVEPFNELRARAAVFEAAVEFIADLFG